MITLTFEVNTPEEAAQLLNRVSSRVETLGPAPAAEVPVPIPDSGAGVPPPPPPLASPAVLKYAEENGVDISIGDITGSGKNGNILKSDVTAYIKANTPPAATEPDPFALDDDPPAAAAATKEQVRTALIGFQTALRDSLIAQGEAEDDAKTTAMETARSLLTKAGNGAAILGALAEDQYGTVVLAATAATNALSA